MITKPAVDGLLSCARQLDHLATHPPAADLVCALASHQIHAAAGGILLVMRGALEAELAAAVTAAAALMPAWVAPSAAGLAAAGELRTLNATLTREQYEGLALAMAFDAAVAWAARRRQLLVMVPRVPAGGKGCTPEEAAGLAGVRTAALLAMDAAVCRLGAEMLKTAAPGGAGELSPVMSLAEMARRLDVSAKTLKRRGWPVSVPGSRQAWRIPLALLDPVERRRLLSGTGDK